MESSRSYFSVPPLSFCRLPLSLSLSLSLSLRLSLQLLLSVECFSQLEVELGLVLTAARRFTDLCLPERGCGEEEGRGEGGREEGERKHFVGMLVEVFLAMMRDPQQFTKFQQISETFDSNAESLTSILGTEYQFGRGSAPNCESLYLNNALAIFTPTRLSLLLDGPLDVPTVKEVVASLSGGHSEPHPPSICPLLLSVILGMDCGM